ncbi:MAG: phosphoadenylyl-sulfate reductase [Anaerolineae bacterium]|nr:phosphoadenylyl-sulfate reductase [Anaerolineales bacterium]
MSASPFTAETDFSEINHYFANRPLDELLSWSLATFGAKGALITSFGPTGMVILDRLAKLCPGVKVITIDTDFLFEETYALRERVQRRYPIQLEIRKSALTPAVQAQVYQPQLWQVNPDLCCHIRKVVPLTEALGGLEAWLTGLRRDQATTRTELPLVAWDDKYHLVKINPLANWTRSQVWTYLLENDVPYNHLHDMGYASIGCTHCTRPTDSSGDERAGRWQGQNKIECGMHYNI